jgi:hypothetical protein
MAHDGRPFGVATVTVHRPVAASLLAVSALLFAPAAAKAECPNVPPWPALTEFGRSAREIVVGTVVGGGGSTFLEFRVDRVLRGGGRVGEVRKIENLLPNWPPGSCTYLMADDGDVIALGLDSLAPDRRTRINTAAWLVGDPDRHYRSGGNAESATLAQIEAIAAMPATSTATNQRTEPPVIAVSLIAAAVTVSLIALRHRLRGPQASAGNRQRPWHR